MPIVMIYQSPRSVEAKRQVIGPITDAIVSAYGLRRDQIQIYFHESSGENWGKAGQLQVDAESAPPAVVDESGMTE